MLIGNEWKHLCMLLIAMSLTSTCKFSTSTTTPHLLPSWLLPRPLANFHVYEHTHVFSPTCHYSLVCASTYNYNPTCNPTCELACNPAYNWTCECVLACTPSYEFLLISKHAHACKNHPENDAIAPKLHDTRCSSSSQRGNNLFQSLQC